jgi:dethiobiotin synthetase/malonyl-CoA O-methyltransferase
MLRGLFVTGTDTNVGKTVTAAALFRRYRQAAPLRYWKPVQTGIEQDDDTAEVRRLGRCTEAEIFDQGVRLPRPVSPHLAARLSGRHITVDELTALVRSQNDPRRWIIEGAGGVLVPLNETELMSGLMQALALPVLIVSRSGLGTINHTLLTLAALRARDLCLAGVVMVGEKNPDNRAAIEHYGAVPVLGEMPAWNALDTATLAAWATSELDPDGRLLDYLR